MEPIEEACTADSIEQQCDDVIEQQCDDVDYVEPTNIVYAESVCNPQRGIYSHAITGFSPEV